MTSPIIQSHPVLVETLRLAVPLRLAELLALRDDERERVALEWASDGARLVAERGDALQFGSKRRGEAARVFDALARGLAALALQPGGVTAFGVHWCVDHRQCRDAERAAAELPSLLDVDPDAGHDGEPARRPIETVEIPGVSR